MADQVSRTFNRQWNSFKVDDPERYIHLLVAYLEHRPKTKFDVWEEEVHRDEGDGTGKDENDEKKVNLALLIP
jgi:hypothetical protein